MRRLGAALALVCSACVETPQAPSGQVAGGGGAVGSTLMPQGGAGTGAMPIAGTSATTGGVANAAGTASGAGGSQGGSTAGSTSPPAQAGEGGEPSEGPLVEWPDANNTGVPVEQTLTPAQSLTVTTNGQIIEGVDLHGSIIVKADDVVIRSSRLTNDNTAIRFEEGSNLRVERVTFVGGGAKTLDGAIQAWGNITVRRIQVSGFGEGIDIYGAGGLIEDNYFHDMANANGKLMDGIEAWEARHLVIRHNVIEMPDGNSVIKLPLDVPVPGGDDVLIENNLLAGGGYTVYGGYDPPNSNPSYTNVRFIANRFSTKFGPKCGFYGPGAFIESSLSHDNVWHETSAPLEL
jgi:hypothetical protein